MINLIMLGRFEFVIFFRKKPFSRKFFICRILVNFLCLLGQSGQKFDCRRPVVDSHWIPHPVFGRQLTTTTEENPMNLSRTWWLVVGYQSTTVVDSRRQPPPTSATGYSRPLVQMHA